MAPVSTSVHAVDNTEAATPDFSKTPVQGFKAYRHPLDPLTSSEISAVSLAVRKYFASQTDIQAVKFITCAIANPPKRNVLAYLGIPLVSGGKVVPLDKEMARRADIDFIDVVKGDAYNAVLKLTEGEWEVERFTKLPEGTQPQLSVRELAAAGEAVRRNPQVQKLAAEIGLKPENIYADGWSIGWDKRFPQRQRLQQALLFARFEEHDNLYAHPLDFIPVLDTNSLEVVHIDFPPRRILSPHKLDAEPVLSVSSTATPGLEQDMLRASGRERFPYPYQPHEYLPDLLSKQPNFQPNTRDALKPLHVVQPEGVSFTMDGNEVMWQKWKLHVGFSHREGLALSTITYNDDGEVRPILYRMSLAEMVVPYAAPEHPHPRKFAFDVGEYGVGTQANELSLGCDCLGKIHYLPGEFIGHDGHPVTIKRAICIHEEDAGLLWKHTDYRPGGRTHSVRSRRLVISMICTLANYEYCFYYYFYQDGSIEFEVKLTGILSVCALAPGDPAGPFSTQVAPGISAQFHQHMFSVRVDPMVDGLQNSIIESDVVSLPDAPTGSAQNWAGNAFVSQERTLRKQQDGARDYDFTKDRRWTIVNPSRKHYSSGKPSGYVLGYRGAATTLLAKPDSWVATRAGFARKSLWVVKDVEDIAGGRMWPAGRNVPQTRKTPADSVEEWVKGDESIENEDLVLFLTLGVNHVPRPEDWPVMPVEQMRLTLKPVHFFKSNPALDVPGGLDKLSTPAFENGATTSHSDGASCGQ